jgi:hypothetical protein
VGMDASRALRPLAAATAAAALLTGVACGPLAARRSERTQPPATATPTTVAPPTATTAPGTTAAPSATAPVRTDDLEAGLQQADGQLSQTGSAVGDADQPSQQSND